ncbi:MAG: hypothetical protein VXW32_06285 [Myxococcota bacterium]|nr:hypothetical protein [Myxococcota bacterium]
MKERLANWWLKQGPTERLHARILLLIVAGFLLHYVAFAAFFIEDAAITFSFSRNLIEGEGLVTYAGGERVEGYSNPLWTFLIAIFYLFKVPPFFAAKLLGGLFGAATLPFVYGIARRCRPHRDDHIALIPPILLAGSTTYVIWASSGLENSLFNLLLAAGLYRVLVEGDNPKAHPLSALCFFGLAITRPEGIVYAAIAGFFRLILAIQSRNVVRPIGKWLAFFWLPFFAYQAWRWSYFGWTWPNTYYAKLDGEDRFKPFRFGSRGWLYTTNYFRAYWIAYLIPLYAIGLATLRDRRRYFVLSITLLGVVMLCWDGTSDGFLIPFEDRHLPQWWPPIRKYWDHGRVFFLLGSAGLLGILTLFHPGAIARLLVLLIGCAAVFFAVFSGGDWMKQWRWYSLVSVPNFILLGLGIGALVEAVPKRFARPLACALVVAILLPNTWNTAFSSPEPETSVKDVRRRVVYMSRVQDRIHLDRVTLLDVDMGAHMWFSASEELHKLGVVAPSWQIVDMAGLVDVPMARHIYQEKFMEQYVFQERNPTFAHVHGGWASKTRIPRLDLWETDYIEIPGYPSGGKSFHMGNHIRKDLIIETEVEENPDRSVAFSAEVKLLDWDIPASVVAQKGDLYIDVWLSAGMHGEDFRFYILLDDREGNEHIASLPPGYDWYTPAEWEAEEAFHGRFDFRLPEHLEPGRYDVGFMVIDSESGQVLTPETAAPSERSINGAAFFNDAVEITTKEAAHDAADDDLQRALGHARTGACASAWEAWREARYHVWRDIGWRADHHSDIMDAMAQCHIQEAERLSEESEIVAALLEAKAYNHRLEAYQAIARPLASDLSQRGEEALAAEQHQEAYPLLRDAVALDPRRSRTRRLAEEARDGMLGIVAKERDSARRKREREEAREERARERAKNRPRRKKEGKNPRLSPDRPAPETTDLPEDAPAPTPFGLPRSLTSPPALSDPPAPPPETP